MPDPSPPPSPLAVRAAIWAVALGLGVWWFATSSAAMRLPEIPLPGRSTAVVQGTAPAVDSIHLYIGSRDIDRAEVDQDVTVKAVVGNSSVAVSRLEYVWSAPFGTFVGSGPTVTWRVPKGTETPVDVVPTLTLVESVPDFEAGLPLAMWQRHTAQDGPVLHVNDTPAELTRLALTFLRDRFGNSDVSPEVCVLDFSDNCRGKESELSDIRISRSQWIVKSATVDVTRIEVAPSMNSAEITTRCIFYDTERQTGRQHYTEADCMLTAVYERPRWFLCDSYTTNGGRTRYLTDAARPAPEPAMAPVR